jgi:hypothetical protein
MNPRGNVVGREGDYVDGGCVVEAPGIGRRVLGIRATDIRSLAPGAMLPDVACDAFPVPARPSPLTCDKAVEAATAVVPESHPPIGAIEFHYGLYGAAWPQGGSGYFTDRAGFVLFTLVDATPLSARQMFVIVRLTKAGRVLADGPWRPFPCCEAPEPSMP